MEANNGGLLRKTTKNQIFSYYFIKIRLKYTGYCQNSVKLLYSKHLNHV